MIFNMITPVQASEVVTLSRPCAPRLLQLKQFPDFYTTKEFPDLYG